MRNNFIATLADVAAENPKIWLLSGDLGYSVLEPFAARFPDRYLNMGVAEQNMAGVAAGIALSGNMVFIYSIGNFPTLRCLEQIRNDICYHGADVKVVALLTFGFRALVSRCCIQVRQKIYADQACCGRAEML